MKSIIGTLLLLGWVAMTGAAGAQEAGAKKADAPAAAEAYKTLDDLLKRVRQGWNAERAENAQREKRFKTERDEQKRLLSEARQTLVDEEARSQRVEATFGLASISGQPVHEQHVRSVAANFVAEVEITGSVLHLRPLLIGSVEWVGQPRSEAQGISVDMSTVSYPSGP